MPLQLTVHYGRHRIAVERPAVERGIAAARGGLIHVVANSIARRMTRAFITGRPSSLMATAPAARKN
jgi:hypothetical protein